MGHPAIAHSDTITDDTLSERLTLLREDPSLWRTPLGADILAEARKRFARISVACGLDAADGATFAWQYWTQELTDAELAANRSNMWRCTGKVIRRAMTREDFAQNRLISTKAARQVAVVGMDAPVHFHSAEDLALIDSRALVFDPFEELDREVAPVRGIGGRQAIAAVRQLLVMAGLTPAQRDLIFDEIARHLTTSANVHAAAEAMRSAPVASVPIAQDRWKALVGLVFGASTNAPGIVHLIGLGHPAPMTEPHIQRLVPVFLQRSPLAAAGVA